MPKDGVQGRGIKLQDISKTWLLTAAEERAVVHLQLPVTNFLELVINEVPKQRIKDFEVIAPRTVINFQDESHPT
jgi:hypothetical protein